MNLKGKEKGKEVAYFEVMFLNFPTGTYGNHEKSHPQ
jgi:hypothetical protein